MHCQLPPFGDREADASVSASASASVGFKASRREARKKGEMSIKFATPKNAGNNNNNNNNSNNS